MRNPHRKVRLYLGGILLGAGLALFGISRYAQLGPIAATSIAVVGVAAVFICLFSLFWALLAAVGYVRLMSGNGIVARWHVSPEEWERFRAFDALRAAQDPTLRNDLRVRSETRPNGVDVVVGRRQLIVDDSYHTLRSLAVPSLRRVNWLPAPADPECLEFTIEYPRGRYGGTFNLTLRVPVPAEARSEGLRVFEHYHTITLQLKR